MRAAGADRADHASDMGRLEDGGWLNDKHVDLVLKYITREPRATCSPPKRKAYLAAVPASSEAGQSLVHAFPAQFYKCLQQGQSFPSGYAKVASWSKDFDVFSKRCRPPTLPFLPSREQNTSALPLCFVIMRPLIATRRRGVCGVPLLQVRVRADRGPEALEPRGVLQP